MPGPPGVAKQRMPHEDPGLHSSVTVGTVTTRLTVTVPQGIAGGDLVRVAAPDGSYHSIMVPGGLTSGQQFSVELLAAGTHAGSELQRLRVRAPDFLSTRTRSRILPCIVPSFLWANARAARANWPVADGARCRASSPARDAAGGAAQPLCARGAADKACRRPCLLSRRDQAATAMHRAAPRLVRGHARPPDAVPSRMAGYGAWPPIMR